MGRILRLISAVFAMIFAIGVVVSRLETRKGWVKNHNPYGVYERFVKRPLDFALSLSGLILFGPILIILAITVRVNMGTPVIFTQDRPGLGGKIFKLKKFRTMTDERDEKGNLLPDEKRLTKFGKMMRTTSMDELPELLNIIKGDLSIVGPRPLLVEYLPYYSENENKRHDVRPGLTGLAQVNGRNNLNWDKRFATDVEYVDNISFKMDLCIVMKTIKKVIIHEDVLEDTSKGETNFAEERRAGRI